jgi:dTDP-4-amino-4,6-dideoxy-D-galactose acyltransferase
MASYPARFAFYPATSFLRHHQKALADQYAAWLNGCVADGILESGKDFPHVHYRQLEWDSRHFGLPVFKIELLDIEASSIGQCARELQDFRASVLANHARAYSFMEVPCEDIETIQALGLAGFRLIETRLTYWLDDVQSWRGVHRYPSRSATLHDIDDLRKVAASARNDFDRFHADPFWTREEADGMLATFAENSVRGFADITLVPESAEGMAGAFLTGNFDRETTTLIGRKVGRMVLSAVSPERRGGYLKLISELTQWFKEREVEVIYLTTQSTNRAVVRVWEKLGYSFGRSSHIFAASHEKLTV